LTPTEEVQLSLEQAFYLVADLKRLDVYLPSPPPFQQQQQEEEEEGLEEERPEWHAMNLGNGKAEEQQQQQQQQQQQEEEEEEEVEEVAAATEPTENAEPKALSVVECWKAYVINYVRGAPTLLSSTTFLSFLFLLVPFEVSH
jgi:hypothetical protein